MVCRNITKEHKIRHESVIKKGKKVVSKAMRQKIEEGLTD